MSGDDIQLENCLLFDISGDHFGEPTLAAEMYRRAVENDVVEMWYYLRSQLTQLKNQLQMGAQSMKNADSLIDQLSVPSMVKRLSDVIDTGVDYKRLVCISICTSYAFIRLISLSRRNKSGLKCPSTRPYVRTFVRPSVHKKFLWHQWNLVCR